MTNYKNISRNIRVLYAVLVALALALTALCELNILPIEGMLLNVDPGTMYIIEVASLFGVGVGIFAALKGYTQARAAISAAMARFLIFVCILEYLLYIWSNIVYTISDHASIANSGVFYIAR